MSQYRNPLVIIALVLIIVAALVFILINVDVGLK